MDKNTMCFHEVRSLFAPGNIPWWGAFKDGNVIELFNDYNKVAKYESQKNVDVHMIPMKTNMNTESSPEWNTTKPVFVANCKRLLGYLEANRKKIDNTGWIEVYFMYNMQTPDMIFDFPKYRKTVFEKIEELAGIMKNDTTLGTSVIIQQMAPEFVSKMNNILAAKPRYNLRPRKPVNYIY